VSSVTGVADAGHLRYSHGSSPVCASMWLGIWVEITVWKERGEHEGNGQAQLHPVSLTL
jgi:hypothetical protein